jgi:hypothetical protein
MYKEEDVALEVLNNAIDSGINYLDTAQSYGRGESETRVGKLMGSRRKEVFLASKIQPRGYDEAMRSVEASLKRLQIDQIDLFHIHGLGDEDDLDKIEAKDGVLRAAYRIREEKLARFIGVTCHSFAPVLAKALERHDFDCTQMALNAALAGMNPPGGGFRPYTDLSTSFQDQALPIANRKNMGVIAMKVFGQGKIQNAPTPKQLIEYSLSLPVSSAVVGMNERRYIKENISIAKSFSPMPEREMKGISNELSRRQKAELDLYFSDHVDA